MRAVAEVTVDIIRGVVAIYHGFWRRHIGGNTADSDRLMETIQLSGDVEVRRFDAYGNPIVLSTQRLDIDPNRETLETQETVHMVTASITQTGQGMFADLNRDEINFHSANSGHYASRGNNAATEQ